jgi:hypothetical protein
MTPFVQGLIIILFTLFFGLLAVTVIITYMFTHRFRVRDPINRNNYITDFWVWETKDKESGVLYWKSVFWQSKLYTPKPPESAINVGQRGRKFAEAYKLSEDEFCYIDDKGITIKEIETKDGYIKKVIADIVKVTNEGTEFNIVDTFKPFSITQRDTLINQHKKAIEISSKRWSPDKIMAITGFAGLTIIIVCMFIFWGDLARPVLDAGSQNIEIMRRQEQITSNQIELASQLGIELKKTSQTPTPEQSQGLIDQVPPEDFDPVSDPLYIYKK